MKGDLALLPVSWAYPLGCRETAAGFGSRTAALNGRPLRYFLREMEIPPRSLDKGEDSAVRAMARLGRVDQDALIRYTPTQLNSKFYTVAGEKLGRLAINRTYFRFCPICVEEDLRQFDGPQHTRPWLRLEWTISHIRSCQRHGIIFEATQPIRRPFEPFDFIETITELLPSMRARSDDAHIAPPSLFQSWFIARLDGYNDEGNWLDDLPLYVGASFCEALGLSALQHPKVKTSSLGPIDWAAAADSGFKIASAGEDSIGDLLGRLNEAQNNTRGVWGPRDTFGYAYGLLQKTVGDPNYEKLRNVFRRVAMESIPLGPGTDVLGHKVEARRVHTVRTAARDSGAHALTIRRMFRRMGIADDRQRSGPMDHRITVVSDEVQHVVEAMKTAVATPRVEKILGVPRTHLSELIARGHLPTITGTAGLAYSKHRFSLDDLERLRTQLFAGAVVVDTPLERQLDVMATRRAATCSLQDLFNLIFSGQLRWKGRLSGRSDYGALLLDADEVTRIVRSRDTKTGFTKEELADYIPGMARESVQALVDGGYLRTVEEFNPEARRKCIVVSRSSADAFRTTYVALGELVQSSGLHHKKVRLLLRSVGIEEALSRVQYGAFFYLRDEVQRAQQADPDFWKYDKAVAQRKARLRNKG